MTGPPLWECLANYGLFGKLPIIHFLDVFVSHMDSLGIHVLLLHRLHLVLCSAYWLRVYTTVCGGSFVCWHCLLKWNVHAKAPDQGPVPFLIFAPTPWPIVTESRGVGVEIYPYALGHPFKNKWCHCDALCSTWGPACVRCRHPSVTRHNMRLENNIKMRRNAHLSTTNQKWKLTLPIDFNITFKLAN